MRIPAFALATFALAATACTDPSDPTGPNPDLPDASTVETDAGTDASCADVQQIMGTPLACVDLENVHYNVNIVMVTGDFVTGSCQFKGMDTMDTNLRRFMFQLPFTGHGTIKIGDNKLVWTDEQGQTVLSCAK